MNMIKSVIVIALFCTALFSISYAHAQEYPSPEYYKCIQELDGPQPLPAHQSSAFTCSNREIKRQDVTLNEEYKKLAKTLNAEQKELLIKAQKSWLRFRENWCQFDKIGPSAPGGEMNYNLCIIELTGKQISNIKSYIF